MKQFKVLWTGGWDSTFRIVELSRQEVEIQPIYILDPNRKSYKYEKVAMKSIVKALKEKEETKAKILDVLEIKLEDIPKNEEITEAYKKINEETGLGTQYDWIGRLSKKIPNMEIGIENTDTENSLMINTIRKFGKLTFIENDIGIIDKENSTDELNLVCGDLRYPIIKRTELDMLNLIKKWHYEDVMKLIWFCHSPIKGKPCGICHPCISKVEAGMKFLLPEEALKNYKKQMKIRRIFGKKIENIYTKIKRKINNFKNKKERI